MLRSMIVMSLVAASVGLSAQNRNTRGDSFGQPADAWCAETDRWNNRDRTTCDVREETLTVSSLDVDTGGNGGIHVRGVGGSASHVRFRIVAHGRSDTDARDLAKAIDISINDGRIRARGPRTSGGEGWSVDVEIESPRDQPLTLNTSNGGIRIEAITSVDKRNELATRDGRRQRSTDNRRPARRSAADDFREMPASETAGESGIDRGHASAGQILDSHRARHAPAQRRFARQRDVELACFEQRFDVRASAQHDQNDHEARHRGPSRRRPLECIFAFSSL